MLQAEPYTGPRDSIELVADFLDDCRWRGLTRATLHNYRWALDRLIAEFQDLPLTPRELAPVLDDDSLAQESRRQLLKVLRLFYSWTAQEYGAPNPSELLGRIPKRRTLPRVLTGEEVHRLVDVAGKPDVGVLSTLHSLDFAQKLDTWPNRRTSCCGWPNDIFHCRG